MSTAATKWIIGIIALVVLVAVGFSLSDRSQQVDEEQITIGALLILSGDAAAWGENAQKGITMAVDAFNQRTDTEVRMIFEDTGGENKQAVSGYHKLVEIDKVDAVIGPLFQSEVASVAPLVAQDNLPVVTSSYAPLENRPNPRNPLMIWMDPSTEAARMAEYIFDQGIRTVGVIGTLDSWESEVSNSFVDAFTNLGGEIVFKDLVQPDTTDMRPTVTKALAGDPEAVFIGTYYQFIPTTRVLREFGYDGNMFSIEVDSYLASETALFSSGLQFISPDFYTEEFIQKFEARHGHRPGIPAGQAYDAMNILLSLLTEYDDTESVLEAMEAFDEYDGVSGNIVITEDDTTLFPTAIFELQNGEAVKVQ